MPCFNESDVVTGFNDNKCFSSVAHRIKGEQVAPNRVIDWLLVFNAQAVIFQLFPGDGHEMDDIMNMKWMIKWDEIKNGMGHKDNRVDNFLLSLEIGREGYGRAI